MPPANPECPLCKRTDTAIIHGRVYKQRQWHLAQCRACDLHFTFPFPTLADIQTFYSGGFHRDLLAEGATEKAFGPKFQRYLTAISAVFPSGRVLDIGCATGLLPRFLEDHGYQAEGLEVNPDTAKWGSEHYRIPIHVGTLEEFVISDGNRQAYDVVTMTDVLEHTENPLDSLRRVNELVKPGGGALITFPDIRSLKTRYYQALARWGKRDWLWINSNVPLHTWEFTREVATRCFATAGFDVVGFRRAEMEEDRFPGWLSVLNWPVRPLMVPPLTSLFGSQMEFVLKKH